MNNYCSNCPNRKRCKTLCETAEIFVNQDYVSRNRLEVLECDLSIPIDNLQKQDVFPVPDNNLKDWKYFVKKYDMTSTQKKYIYLKYWKRWSLNKIGKKYNVSHQTVAQTLERFKDKFK